MKKYILFLILIASLAFAGCEDLMEPAPRNFKDVTQMYTDPAYAQGFLVHAYRTIPGYYDQSDYATDDAVTNDRNNSYLRIATGSWSSITNPANRWTDAYGAIQNINIFLENADLVHWADDKDAAEFFRRRMKGEAYGLRALFHYYLLRSHAGYTENGELLGVPIFTKFIDTQADFNIPRDSFEDCIAQIYLDLDSAEYYLPYEYEDIKRGDLENIPEELLKILLNSEDLKEKYGHIPIENRLESIIEAETDLPALLSKYNRVYGHYARQLFNGLIANSFRARVSLLAASPAYNEDNSTEKWIKAADAAAKVLNHINGISGLDPNGGTYYANTRELNSLGNGVNPKEIIWRENLQTNNSSQESDHFPPSLYGNGRLNPTQNLVDAFPMVNGYPITDERSGFDEEKPYTGRDPRFAKYIIFNGSKAGVTSKVIYTGSGEESENDGIGRGDVNKSTRTGYYMKKRLRMDVNLHPSSVTGQSKYNPRIRYTEIFLAYAEAANEAWGPTGSGTHAYSAYDVIKAIRKRAGIKDGDLWLEESADSKEKMRELIRNERRLELCFEGFRFWDLRRWKVDLTEHARGIDASDDYKEIIVEERDFKDYMYYGPIPNSEILKYDQLQQNRGW